MAEFYRLEPSDTQRQFPMPKASARLNGPQIRLQSQAITVYNAQRMQVPTSMTDAATSKNVIGLSVLLLLAAAVFGLLNGQKVKALRLNVAEATATREAVEQRALAEKKALKEREATAVAATVKAQEAEVQAAKVEADLAQLQTEKADLQTKLQTNQAEIASLQRKAEETVAKPGDNPGAASPAELQAQLDETRRQLESAERENAFLSDRMHGVQERSTQLEDTQRRRREAGPVRAGVRGTILAVNQAYNFVVLNLGGRQGVEPNAEMLVLRDGTLIGKIRVSSVEPSTAIGDIITSSLERGVQVQPGDIVVYAGSNS